MKLQVRRTNFHIALLAITTVIVIAACTNGEDPAPSSTVPATTATPSPQTPTLITPSPTSAPTATLATEPTPAPTSTQAFPTATTPRPTSTVTQTPQPPTPTNTGIPATKRPAPTQTKTEPPTPTAAPTTPPQPTVVPSPTPSPTPLPTGPIPQVGTEVAFPGLHYATFGDNTVLLTHPNDGSNRVAVVEKEGKISIFANSASTNVVETLLDIRSKVSTAGNEEGLLGLAFHPDFSENGYFYVYYSAANPRRSVLSRYTLESGATGANPNSELLVLEIPQPYSNHNGGMIEFGPDGYLYTALGDGGSSGDPLGHGQTTSTLLGSILRIDVDTPSNGRQYGIPADNPFANSANSSSDPRPEIYAYGLRNPWRFSFDRTTGELWAGDVGQNKWEEIDVVVKGGNYGWNILEASHCFKPSSNCDSSGTILPISEHDHAGRCSITGGYVYRGNALPELQGVYIYADFCSGEIWGIRSNQREAEPQLIATGHKWIASFGEDAEGNIYVLSLGSQVQRITLK